MKIRSITVCAGRTVTMPKCSYQNARPQINLTADLEEGEDAIEKARELHRLAENLLEDQCDELLAFIAARQQARIKKQ